MEEPKDKAGVVVNIPISFPGWREVLRTEFPDPAELKILEQDIFAYMFCCFATTYKKRFRGARQGNFSLIKDVLSL
jgi:hypothetical protein